MTDLRDFARWLPVCALALGGLAVPGGDTRAAEDEDELARLLARPVYGSTRLAGASKYDQDVGEAPAMVYVRTGGEIRAQGYRTLAEVLDSLPGTHLRNDRVYTYTGVRGVSRPGDYSSRLLLLIDGMRVNDAIYDSATGGGEFPLDVSLIDRVEYIPGPGSALYGSNAVLGVVNVITRSAAQVGGPRVQLGAGAGRERTAAATWGGDLGPVRVVLGASLLRAQGETAVYFPAYDDPADNGGIAERLDNERSTRLFAKATWGWLTLTSVMSDRVKRDPTGAFGVIFNTDSYSVDRYALTGLTFSRRLDETHELFARLGLSAYDYVGGGLYDVDAQRVPGHTRSRARWATGEMRYIWSGLRDHRLLLGVEYQNNFSQYLYSADLEPAPQVFLDRKFTSTRAAFFVTDEWHVLPSVHLTLGLRSDRRLDHGHSLTPRVAAVWTASPSWTFKLQHGSAFREPNVSETHYADGTQVDNAALSVERMRSTEVSALWRPREGLEVTASAYSFQLSESIALTTLPSGLEQYVNSGRLRSRGVELEATQEFASGLRVRGSVSLQRGIDLDTGRALNDSPHHLLKLMVTAPGPWVGSRLGGHLVHLGRRSTLAGATLPSSTRIDAQLTHTPPGQGWSVSVGLYNLTGERASDPAGPEHRQDTLPTLRRGWRVQVERAL